MRARYFLVLVCILLIVCSGCSTLARQVSNRLSYNCISNGGIRVQLNRHLEFGGPYLSGELASPDGSAVIQLWTVGKKQVIQLWYPTTGESVPLQHNVIAASMWDWKWSPDSQFVYYVWKEKDYSFSNAIAKRDGTRAVLRPLESAWDSVSLSLNDFSPDSNYLWLYDYHTNTLSVVSTHTFQQDIMWSLGLGGGPNVSVATFTDTGKLVFNLDNQLYIADPISKRIDSTTFIKSFYIDYQYILYLSISIEWSPDGKYVAVMYRPTGTDLHLDVFAVEDVTPILVDKIVIPMAGEYFASYDFSRQFARWSDEGHNFMFFRPSGNNVTVQSEINFAQRYDLWQYNPETRDAQRVTDHIVQFSSSNNALITTRLDHGSVVEELRSMTGTSATIIANYQEQEADPHWCEFKNKLLECQFIDGPWQVWFLDDTGAVTWTWTAPGKPEERAGRPFATHSPNGRFATVIWQHNAETWLDLADFDSRETYHLPVTGDTIAPISRFYGDVIPDYWWWVEFFPSPDEDIWLIHARGYDGSTVLFRLNPEQSTSAKVFQIQTPIRNILWSPDNRLILFTNVQSGNPAPSLLALEADGSHLWDLGYFPKYEYLAWDKCGGIRTLLLGAKR